MKLLDFVLCEDIRLELAGRFSLIGVYQDLIFHSDISAPNAGWPKKIQKFCAMARFVLDGNEIMITGSFRALREGYDEKTLLEFKSEPQQHSAYLHIPVVINNFALIAPGALRFKFCYECATGKGETIIPQPMRIIELKPE